MDQVTGVGTGKAGRLFTTVELAAAGRLVQLKLPAADAPLVVDLIEGLARGAHPPAEVPPTIWSRGLDPVWPEPVMSEPPTPEPVLPDPVIPEPTPEPVLPQPGTPEPVMPEPGAPEPVIPQPGTPPPLLPDFEVRPVEVREAEVREFAVPDFEVPDFTGLTVEMPQWTPLPETELPELVLSQGVIDEPAPTPEAAAVLAPVPESDSVAEVDPVTPVEPVPDPTVLAAAAALAELEDMLGQIPATPESNAELPGDEVAAHAAAEVQAEEIEPDPSSGPEYPPGLSPDLVKRLNRLEVLRSSGVMSEEELATSQAEIFELAESKGA